MDISKRNFIKLGTVSALTAFSGTAAAQEIQTQNPDYQDVAILYGTDEALPQAGSGFFEGSNWTKDIYAYLYFTKTGYRYYITQEMDAWEFLPFRLPNYTESNLPAALETGQLVYNTDRDIIALSDGDDWEYPVVGDDILINPVTVSNTTTETLIWDAGLNQGSLKVGRSYEVSLFGKFSNASTNDTVTINLYLGGTLVANVESTGKNASEAPWRAKLIFTVRDTGANSEVQPHTLAKFNQEDADDHHAPVTVDTTVPKQIEAYAQWNNAKTGNTITLGQGYMKEVS